MQVAAKIHHRFGHVALPNYIISKTDAVSDLLEVALMLQQVGLLGSCHELHLNIIPLFETIADLRICGVIMNELFSIPFYRELLKSRGDTQEVMLVIPTATKMAVTLLPIGNYIRLNSSWLRCLKTMALNCDFSTAVAAQWRGGGPSYEAILAQPPGSVNAQIRITEQGEVIASKYSDPEIGRRNLEILIAATIEATLLHNHSDSS